MPLNIPKIFLKNLQEQEAFNVENYFIDFL